MIFNQNQVISYFLILSYKLYEKVGQYHFSIAQYEQEIVTQIKGEVETKNTAQKGDYIINNPLGEIYVVKPAKFDSKYVVVVLNSDMTGIAECLPNKQYAAQYFGESFEMETAWKDTMRVDSGDWLIMPCDKSEVYRVEKEAFELTYKPIE